MNALTWTGMGTAIIGALLVLFYFRRAERRRAAQSVRLHPNLRARIVGENVVGFSTHRLTSALRLRR